MLLINSMNLILEAYLERCASLFFKAKLCFLWKGWLFHDTFLKQGSVCVFFNLLSWTKKLNAFPALQKPQSYCTIEMPKLKKKEGLKCLAFVIIVLLYNPATTLLGIYPIESNPCVHTEICTRILIAVLS